LKANIAIIVIFLEVGIIGGCTTSSGEVEHSMPVLTNTNLANINGIKQIDKEAVKWYRKSAKQGEAYGQFNLGTLYLKGRGVKQSDKEAANWYRKAAEQGNANGQRLLGSMYEKGRGVKQSDKEAVKWYRKAAEQGDAYGLLYLGSTYLKGRGVKQTYKPCVEVRQCALVLRSLIIRSWKKPESFKSGRKVIVTIKMKKNGELIATKIKESSGYKPFDESALEAVKMVFPFKEIQGLSSEMYDKRFRSFLLHFMSPEFN
jgi:TonB family protein